MVAAGASSVVGRGHRSPPFFVYPEPVEGYTSRMKATVVGLQGELGSGKTAFAQALGKMMGASEHIVSPTFVIMKSYDINWRGFRKLIHIDAYRIESESELLNLGWDELVENPQHLILVEWPERVEGIMPEDSRRIFFKHEI